MLLQTFILCLIVYNVVAFHRARLVPAGGKRLFSSITREIRSVLTLSAATANSGITFAPGCLPLSSDATTLSEALDEIIAHAKAASLVPTAALFFISSAYDTATYDYQIISTKLKSSFPSIKSLLGSNTGCPVGPLSDRPIPVELESTTGISIYFFEQELTGDDATIFSLADDEVKQYILDNTDAKLVPLSSSAPEKGIAFLFATDNISSKLSKVIGTVAKKEHVQVSGAVASSITMLQSPKVFVSLDEGQTLTRHSTGIVGLIIKNPNIIVRNYIAKSAIATGPVYRIVDRRVSTILALEPILPSHSKYPMVETKSPLEHLAQVLEVISNEDATALKRELYVGVLPSPSTDNNHIDITQSDISYAQKPTAFDPMTGSISLPYLEDLSLFTGVKDFLFRFCVRSPATARQALANTINTIRQDNNHAQQDGLQTMGALLFGSQDRGVKVFRVRDWESQQLQTVMNAADGKNNGVVSVGGMFGAGAFFQSDKEAAFTEMDAVYSIIYKKVTASAPSTTSTKTTATAPVTSTLPKSVSAVIAASLVADLLLPFERSEQSDDEHDLCIVSKRDPESAHPLKVGSMDYFVPDKLPRPRHVLEAFCWEREKEVDRLRERYAMNRALSMAKTVETRLGKPHNTLHTAVKERIEKNGVLSSGGRQTPLIIPEILRASVNLGTHSSVESDTTWIVNQVRDISSAFSMSVSGPIVAVSAQADSSVFQGQYEDFEALKKMTTYPIVCNDFVLFAYQLFRAKASGVDAVKLMASALPMQDVAYLAKTAKALGLNTIIVVNSKEQLLAVLEGIPAVEAISVSSRNMKLWKIDSGRGQRILDDEVVKAAIEKRRSNTAEPFVLCREGFAEPSELEIASDQGVDVVFLGEELLADPSVGIVNAIKSWIL